MVALDLIQDHGKLLVISNISKMGNVNRLIVSALSHGFVPILVGCESMPTERLLSGLADDPDTKLCRVDSFDKLSRWLVDSGYTMIGIEITDASKDITSISLGCTRGKIALMPGNEGTGLTIVQKSCCHDFVFIPQYSASIESFNVAVATTVVLNYLAK